MINLESRLQRVRYGSAGQMILREPGDEFDNGVDTRIRLVTFVACQAESSNPLGCLGPFEQLADMNLNVHGCETKVTTRMLIK
jgi:hypothetical protein